LVGREIDDNGLCIADHHMSRVHARIAFDAPAGLYRIGDASSRNGTFVNGQRVETVLLSDGDLIRVGNTLLVYSEGSARDRMRQRAAALARSPLHLLVRGETGTGKEVLGRFIHQESGRSGELIAVNCASIPGDLLAAELFGHTKQAFSGATQARAGLFAAAKGGTLLLDEIGDSPLEMQAALLRAIQEKSVRAVGAEREVAVDVRIIAATNADLEEAVRRGTFRADLFARLSQAQLIVPPLRARRTELLALCDEQLIDRSTKLNMTADAAEALLLWHWPMNVRELQSVIRTHVVLHGASPLDLASLAEQAPAIAAPAFERKRGAPKATIKSTFPPPEAGNPRAKLRSLLEQNAGNVSAVAIALGKPRAQIYRWMRSMGLSADKFRR
jgi:transcriptional regulator with GAF, ATPase, and Fis domain